MEDATIRRYSLLHWSRIAEKEREKAIAVYGCGQNHKSEATK